MKCGGATACLYKFALGSTPVRWSYARSGAICGWTTRRSVVQRTWRLASSSLRRRAQSSSPLRRCAWSRALLGSTRSARYRSRGSTRRLRSSSWWGPAPPAPGSRPRSGTGSPALSAAAPRWSRSATLLTGRASAAARWSPWLESRGSASLALSGRSPTPLTSTAGARLRPAQSPTARRLPTCRSSISSALLGTDEALAPLKILLVERTDANPLFLEESVRALVETGALAGERGAYQLTRPVEQLRMPATVQAILAARIDRLAPEAKRLLQAAAVIGKDVALPLLLAIADAPEPDVRADLARLQAAEFLYEVRLFPDLEFTFKHALTLEVAYQGLLQDRRRGLHARITEAIERLAAERITEQSERLAHHALQGELWEKAVAYLHQAGLRAMARGANLEAVPYLEEALGTLRHLPETRRRSQLAVDIRIDIRNALLPLGDCTRMLDHLQHAEVLARSLGDQHRLGRIAALMVVL